MIRYHSFYSWHREGEYDHLCDDRDRAMLKWVRAFNRYDLVSAPVMDGEGHVLGVAVGSIHVEERLQSGGRDGADSFGDRDVDPIPGETDLPARAHVVQRLRLDHRP